MSTNSIFEAIFKQRPNHERYLIREQFSLHSALLSHLSGFISNQQVQNIQVLGKAFSHERQQSLYSAQTWSRRGRGDASCRFHPRHSIAGQKVSSLDMKQPTLNTHAWARYDITVVTEYIKDNFQMFKFSYIHCTQTIVASVPQPPNPHNNYINHYRAAKRLANRLITRILNV